ncbi:MAG: DUF542 domain-containing protein [Lutibacter sp.]|jgi:regulator of cell morphogenesis and NO signaling|nr:DUF542 domain-containing protein [Lutibacter sp.]
MSIQPHTTVAETVATHVGAAHVFSKYEIDFCCGGHHTLEQVCKEKGLSLNKLQAEITALASTLSSDDSPVISGVADLIARIETVYHPYFQEHIPPILALSDKVARVHGALHSELNQLRDLFHELADRLTDQYNLEKKLFFPLLNQLLSKEKSPVSVVSETGESLEKILQNTRLFHKELSSYFDNIATLTNTYSPPEGACRSFQALYAKLQDFHRKLDGYRDLETVELFPRLIQSINS